MWRAEVRWRDKDYEKRREKGDAASHCIVLYISRKSVPHYHKILLVTVYVYFFKGSSLAN